MRNIMEINETLKYEYKEAKRIIQKAKQNKKLVVFLGAGISMNYGMPSWKTAIQEIASRLGISHFGDNDVLKIPQYYYNQRGKKEYTDLIRKIFKYNKKLRPISPSLRIMDKIWNLDADTIITTNYDNLVENFATKRHETLEVISSDIDFPYNDVGRKLIKMHGDFDHDNFVLKEDDYLHYSENFKLIQNYIKSIIGNDVVLFLGYSFNDPDIKQIFTWVKDILKYDFQRAYLINVTDEYDKNVEDYYRRLGVNIIYSKSWIGDKYTPAKSLAKILDIINPSINASPLNLVYKKLSPFKNFNYIHSSYLKEAFQSGDNNLILRSENNSIAKIIKKIFLPNEKLDSKSQRNSKEIRRLLKNSSYREVAIVSQNKTDDLNIIKIKRWNIPSWFKLIFNFNYKKLRQLKIKNDVILQSKEDKPELCMIQATICYYLEDYKSCYDYLLKAENLFYSLEMYTEYFIALLNRKMVAQIIAYDYSFSEELRKKMIEDYKHIDLERTLNNLPTLNGDSNQFLNDLSKSILISTLFLKLYKETVEVNKEATTSYALFAGLAEYKKLRLDMQDIYNYEIGNNILIDYKFIRLSHMYLMSIISSIEASNTEINNTQTLQEKNITAKDLQKIDINLLLQFSGNVEDLKKIFKDCEFASISLNYDTLQYLKAVLKNLIYEVSKNPSFRSINCFWAVIYLLQFLKVDSDTVKFIAKNLVNQIDERSLILYKLWIYNFMNISLKQGLISKTDYRYFENILEKSLNVILPLSNSKDYKNLISYFASKLKEFGHPYNNIEMIKSLIIKGKADLLTSLYPFCSKDIQKIIKESNLMQNFSDNILDYLRYLDEIKNDIISPNKKYEAKIIKYLKNNSNSQRHIYPDPREDIVVKFLNNYFMDHKKVIDFTYLKVVINSLNIDDFYKWLIDPSNFNYEKDFDVNWLKRCGEPVLQQIALNKKVKKNIKKALTIEFKNGNNDRELIKIYFKHFN